MSMFDNLFSDMIVQNLAEARSISLEDARKEMPNLSFLEYYMLSEANGTSIVPPSGNTISPSTQGTIASKSPSQVKPMWPGKGAPVETGMTVGLKGPNGTPVPGEITQVDATAKGVKVKNPTTGQDEWMNMDTLEPFAAGTNQSSQNVTSTEESKELVRLRELAGIKENCSAGATGAGAIAVAPSTMGKVKKRQETTESLPKKEYTRTAPPKTIVGDTKPMQNSGELSATLVANGKPSASRRKRT